MTADHPIWDLLRLMEQTDEELVALFPDAVAGPAGRGKLVCASLMADCLALHRGVRFLLREGLGDEAGVLTRKQMDVTAVLVYFGGQVRRLEELAAQFMYDLYKRELSLYRADKKAGYRKEAAKAQREVLDEMRELKREWNTAGNVGKVPEFPGTAALLRAMKQDNKQWVLERGHLYVHVSRMGLEGRLRDAGTREAHFDTNGDPNRCASVGAVAVDLLLAAAQGAVPALEWGDECAAAVAALRKRVSDEVVVLLRRRSELVKRAN